MRIACVAIGLLWCASAGAEPLYRLPWGDGHSFMFTQVPGGRITTHFTKATLHAVDIAMPAGTAILAARGGMVEAVAEHHGASAEEEPLTYEGNFVRVRHADGTAAIYAHLRHRGVAVAVGDTVEEGRLLGYSGATGDVERPHLHFAVIRVQKNSAGWQEDISVPVTFYVGVPPVAFAPRATVWAAANYSGAAQVPRAASEMRLFPRSRAVLAPGEEAGAWSVLALWVACGAAALGWFWRFCRD